MTLSDSHLEKLAELNDAITNKYSDYFIFTSKTSCFNSRFPEPLKLNPNRNYKLGLQYFTTSNYLININETNNKFHYSIDSGKTWIKLTLEKGAYEIIQISEELYRQMKSKKHINEDEKKTPFFIIGVNFATFKSFININKQGVQIDFTKNDTFRDLLGFNSKVLSYGYNISEKTVQIFNTSCILIKCNLVEGGYINGKKEGILYSFPAMTVPIGFKINISPTTIVYLPINNKVISNINFNITDQDGKTIDLKGEEIVIAVHLIQD